MKKLTDYKIMPIFPMAPVSDPQVSPDGGRVLFTYTTVNMKEDRYDSHIWLHELRTRKTRQFTHGRSNESNPRWSPKEDRILFTSNRSSLGDPKVEGKNKKRAQLFVIPADGGEARQITQVEGGVQRPAWSPDGKSVLFASRVEKGEKVEDSDVKIIRRIRYKLDGQGFFQGKRVHLFTVPSKGGKARQITDGEFDVDAASWSPDSKGVAFVTNMDEDADLVQYRNIFLVSARGGEPELLWKGEGPIGALSWSPDGRYLAFTGRVIEDPDLIFYRNTELFALPVDGSKPRLLTGEFDRTLRGARELVWSPDSKHVYFTFPDLGTVQIGKADLDGNVERVTEGSMNRGFFTMDAAGEVIAFNAASTSTPHELWIQDEGGARKVTEMNKGLLRRLKISEPEEFWFTASDGVEVQGWIIRPHDYIEGETYPTVLQIHGGPHSAYSFTLDPAVHEFQVLASHGYAVVYANPRASVGFGEKFSRAVSGHWGERDYLDVMEAMDYVIETYPFVDGSRLGIAGGSYGGFMTNWVVGHTDRFKAAVTMRSISNWYSQWGTSDISFRGHEVTWGKNPWDNVEEVLSKSPVTYVKNVVTPLLIIHSENDYRCPMGQDELLFTALKKLGRTTEFVRFPDEPHGLSRTGKPRHRVERLQHIVRWFDRYLR
jgi:dipeptidyl aminopeptidase/acylaminoacyl peptidase